MVDQPTTQPSVTEAQINAVMTTITAKLGGVFVTPSAIEPILEGMVNENNALVPIANTVWDIAQRMHKQTGEALTLVAMQKVMMEELTKERDGLIEETEFQYQSGFDEGVCAGEEIAWEDIYLQGIGTFAQAVADNGITDVTDIQVEQFADDLYEGRLDAKAKQMLRDLIVYVSTKAETEMSEVKF
jgi:hypothetical protein